MDTLIEIKKRNVDNIDIYEFRGELDETNADKAFKGIYESIGDFTKKRIIFNFRGLQYLNSKSIGYIADIYSNLDDHNGELYICECNEEVKDTLELVGISGIVSLLATEEEAIDEAK